MSMANNPPGWQGPLRQLCERLGLHQRLAYDPVWSAAPDFLGLVAGHVLARKPAVIVECGSGTSTLMLARCCELNGRGKVLSLENGADYAERTRAELARHGLGQHAEVVHAPLMQQTVGGREYLWYGLGKLPACSIDMLVIDGPPGHIQRHSRYPALPLLASRLAEGCVVFLDDAGRPDELEIVSMWQSEFPRIGHEYISTQRGCAVLIFRR